MEAGPQLNDVSDDRESVLLYIFHQRRAKQSPPKKEFGFHKLLEGYFSIIFLLLDRLLTGLRILYMDLDTDVYNSRSDNHNRELGINIQRTSEAFI